MRDPQQALEGFAPPAVASDAMPMPMPSPMLDTAPNGRSDEAGRSDRVPATVTHAVVTSPAAPAATGLPKVQPFVLPLDELAGIAQGSGLSWINSDAEKISMAQAAIAAQPKAIHVPRERTAAVSLDDGPLVLVETKRDLRNMTLPFEQPSS